jgi:hypothetical protein
MRALRSPIAENKQCSASTALTLTLFRRERGPDFDLSERPSAVPIQPFQQYSRLLTHLLVGVVFGRSG